MQERRKKTKITNKIVGNRMVRMTRKLRNKVEHRMQINKRRNRINKDLGPMRTHRIKTSLLKMPKNSEAKQQQARILRRT